MKTIVTLFCGFFLAYATFAQTSEITYEEVKLTNVGSISIPSIMELQSGVYKELSNSYSKELGFDVSGVIIFQQAGLNDIFKTRKRSSTYARVMIEETSGKAGEYRRLDSKLVVTTRELEVLNSQSKNEITNQFQSSGMGLKLIRWDGVSVAKIGGFDVLRTAYLRQLNDNPAVYVELYQIENYDRLYTLTISYREEDSSIWKDVLDKTKSSFKITNIRTPANVAQQKSESDYSVYRDEKFPFSLFYPKDWTQLEPTHAQTRFKIAKEDGLYLTDFNVVVTYAEAAKNMTPAAFVNELIVRPELINALVKQGNPTAKLISSGKTYLSNREAFFVKSEATYRTLDEKNEMTVFQIMTMNNGNTYTLTFRALTDEFDENFPIFKFIASSFVIRPTEIIVPKKNIQRKSKTPASRKKP